MEPPYFFFSLPIAFSQPIIDHLSSRAASEGISTRGNPGGSALHSRVGWPSDFISSSETLKFGSMWLDFPDVAGHAAHLPQDRVFLPVKDLVGLLREFCQLCSVCEYFFFFQQRGILAWPEGGLLDLAHLVLVGIPPCRRGSGSWPPDDPASPSIPGTLRIACGTRFAVFPDCRTHRGCRYGDRG